MANWHKAPKHQRIKETLLKMGYKDPRPLNSKPKPPKKKRIRHAKIRQAQESPMGNTARTKTFVEQNGVCHYCDKQTEYKEWTVDHLIPTCRGGGNGRSNKVGCCATCNREKGPLTEFEAMATPRSEWKSLHKSALPNIERDTHQPLANNRQK